MLKHPPMSKLPPLPKTKRSFPRPRRHAPRFQLSRRHQRRVTLAAWVALVAGFGALFGGAISNGLDGRHRAEVASLDQRKAMQQSIDHLAKQVSDLKAKLAVAAAATHSQIAKTSARAERRIRLRCDRLDSEGAPHTGAAPAPGAPHRGCRQPAGGGAQLAYFARPAAA